MMHEFQNINVAAHFESLPEKTRKVLAELRDCIFEAAPEAIEMINYGIPAYALVESGKRDKQVMIAGYDKHVGFYPTPVVLEKFNEELGPYKKGKGSVQFPLDKPLPRQLIIKMVKYKLKQVRNI